MSPSGYLEVIAGPMYSGKTEELIRQVKRALIGKKKVQVFKHSIDTRYGTEKKIYSHTGTAIPSSIVSSPREILAQLDDHTQLVAIDEAQWFGKGLIPVVETLLTKGKRVLVAGLPVTFERAPFEPIPTLMAIADSVRKLSAICSICGNDAVFHKRITKKKSIDPTRPDPSFVGRTDAYKARCRNCFTKKP